MEDTNGGVVKATVVSPLRASLVRWEILRRALLPRYSASSATKSDASLMEIRKISRKSSVGFNLIPFQIQAEHFNGSSNASLKDEKVINNKDFCVCYTLPTEISQKLILFQRLENCISIDDFEISDKHNIDNTGIVCSWPSEDVLAYFCVNHADIFRSKRVLELGSGYGLAGMTIAVATSAHEVVISDGNPQVVDYIHKNVTMNARTFGDTNVEPMNLHWNQELDSKMLSSFDIIVASDCTFFTEFHDSLALIVKSLLKHEGTSEAIFLNPKRGDSLGKFLQKVHDIGLCYELVENYDDQIWKRHIEIQDGNDISWPNYDKDHCYPLLVLLYISFGSVVFMSDN